MASAKQKVGLLACNGIGAVHSSVVRLAAQQVASEIGLQQVNLIEALALDADQLAQLHNLPLIAVDGCWEQCASKLLAERGLKPLRLVKLLPLLAAARISLAREDRTSLGPVGRQAVDLLKQALLEAVREASRDE